MSTEKQGTSPSILQPCNDCGTPPPPPPPHNMRKLCSMGPKRSRALDSAEARWRKKVKSWPNMSLRTSSNSDNSSSEGESDLSSWETSEAAGGHQKTWLENEVKPNPKGLNQAFIAGTRAPPKKEGNTTVVLKSKVGKAATRLSHERAGKVVNSMQGGLDEGQVDSATSSKGYYNVGCGKPARKRSFDCTACGTQLFSVLEVLEHADLGVGICKSCHDFILSSPYTLDPNDSSEEQCRWCGEGGRIVMCDRCEKSFCEACIVRNFGPRDLALIHSNCNWSCFCCNPELLRVPLDELKEFQTSAFQRSQKSTFPLERKRTTSARPLMTRDASEDAKLESEGDGATIAELLDREEQKRRKQNRGTWTNSVEVKSIPHKVCRKKPKVTSTLNPVLRTKIRYPVTIQVKQKSELVTDKPAPASATPARAWIRPHQWEKQRQEAAERRKQAEAEGLKSVSTLTNDSSKHTTSDALENLSHCKEGDAYQKQPSEIERLHVKSVDLSDAVVEHKDGVKKVVKFQIGE